MTRNDPILVISEQKQ